MKQLDFQTKIKIKELCPLIFWFWSDFYKFFANILGVNPYELERVYPKIFNKYEVTEKILDGLSEAQVKKLLSELYRISTPFWWENNKKYAEWVAKLKAFKEFIKIDVLEQESEEKEFKERIQEKIKQDEIIKNKSDFLKDLYNAFLLQASEKWKEQQRGFWLEENLYKILMLENIEHKKSFRNKWEQIDGSLKFKSFDYLIECKWTKESAKQEEISIFDGKILSKAQSTRWIFISISWFDASAISRAENNGSPRIVFIDGPEIISVLQEVRTFYELLEDKEYLLTHKWNVYK